MENNCYQQIEIFISGRQLRDLDVFSKSDPFVILYMKQNNAWYQVGRTETINDNLNPNFKKTFLIDYVFEVVQPIRFEVRDDDGNASELIGSVETTVGTLFGAKNQTSILDLGHKSGKIIIRCDRVQEGNQYFIMKFRGVKLMNTDGWFGTSDPFLRIHRQRDDQTYIQIHETEVIMNNLDPMWKVFEIQSIKLANSNDKKIKIECWDWEKSGKNQFIGECYVTLPDLQQSREYTLTNPKHKSPGKLRLDQFSSYVRPSFQDYIRGGLQLNLMVAVDFTGSNGYPNQPTSLHYRHPNQLNQYQVAIQAVGEILLAYDYDKLVPCFGFGATLNFPTMRSNQVTHCFPLSGDPNNIDAVQLPGIMSLYNYALGFVNFSGPTYFSPIISETMRVVRQQQQTEQNTYTILLILTDGVIHDMEQTKQLIVDSSRLPFSIIIIGVGNEDFSMMEELDGDQGLYAGGRKAERDLVQFVPYRNFGGNYQNLARHVLAEIPEQVVKYHQLIGRQPNAPQFIDINQMGYTIQGQQVVQPHIEQPIIQQDPHQPVPQQAPYGQPPPYSQIVQPQVPINPQSTYAQQQYYQQAQQQSLIPQQAMAPQPSRISEQLQPQNFMAQQYGQLPTTDRQSCNLPNTPYMNQTMPHQQYPPSMQYPPMNQSNCPANYPPQNMQQYPPINQSAFKNVKNPME